MKSFATWLLGCAAVAVCGCTTQGTSSTAGGKSAGSAPSVAAHIQRGKTHTPARNDLHNLGIFIQQYNAEWGKPPANVNDLKEYIKRDAPQIYKALSDGKYVVVANPRLASDSVLVYEKELDLNGVRAVLFGDGSVKSINDQDLKAALNNKGG